MWRRELSALQTVDMCAKIAVGISEKEAKGVVLVMNTLRDLLNSKQEAAVAEKKAIPCIAELLTNFCVNEAKVRRNARNHARGGREVCVYDDKLTPEMSRAPSGKSTTELPPVSATPCLTTAAEHVPIGDQTERPVPWVPQVGSKKCTRDQCDEAPADQGVRLRHRAEAAANGDNDGVQH